MKDLLTKEEFSPKRANQLFANRQNQIRYNNLKAAKARREKSFADKPLHKNRLILIKVLGNKKEVTVSEDYLLGAGFAFGYSTHSKYIKGATAVWCIYQFCVQNLSNKQFKIFIDE